MLDEVMRQAQDNPIIRLSMDIRAGKWIEYGGPKECRIMSKENVSDKLLLGADQILCGKNATRHELNKKMRRIKFDAQYKNEPVNGDKIVCLHNEWQKIGAHGDPLVNGMIGTINNIELSSDVFYKPKMVADFVSDNSGAYTDLSMDYKIFTEQETTINKDNWWKYKNAPKPCEFDYAYAVTVHKFQGSEAEKVVVYDEWLGDKDYHTKWLYTAVTRASKMLVVVK
jgi:exodeoxyribonuclease-5